MKKYLVILTIFSLSTSLNAQIIQFTDSHFKQRLLLSDYSNDIAMDLSGFYTRIDQNRDGEIQISEALNIQDLDLYNSNISSISGIQYFTKLKVLHCTNNNISELNLEGLNDLYYLDCSENYIQELDLSSLQNLKIISCSNNSLIKLNVKNGYNEDYLEFSGNYDLTYICSDDGQIESIQNKIDSYNYFNCHINSYCTHTPGGTYYTILGRNRINLGNSSGTNNCDNSSLNLPNFKINFFNGTTTSSYFTNSSGNYRFDVQAGTYVINPIIENTSLFTVSPTQSMVSFPNNYSYIERNFCVAPITNFNDVEIALLPLNTPKPGFDLNFKILYTNKGTSVQNGRINFTFDHSILDLIAAEPQIIEQTGSSSQDDNVLSWNFENLRPYEQREIIFRLNLNSPVETPAVNNGQILNFNAKIESNTDNNFENNLAAITLTTVNSYDPNDIICLEGSNIKPEKVGDYVNYLIRFENNGTANATNIVVKNIIDTEKYDINTLIPLNGSHLFNTVISDTNKVEFFFENIDLPFQNDSNDGYVSYKIKTKSTLQLGDSFSNKANIYFDFNPPIVTNTATTEITALNKKTFEFSNYFKIYPNPVNNFLNIENSLNTDILSIKVFNLLGQLVLDKSESLNKQSLNVSGLKSGQYFIKIYTHEGIGISKFIKK